MSNAKEMRMTTIAEWYKRVEAAWPSNVPALTADEAVKAARRLYRFTMKRTWMGPVEVTSGNRYAWIRRGVMVVNPEHGWKGLVHLMSHAFHNRINDDKPHSRSHARLELKMIKEVIKRGWLGGILQPEPRPTITPQDSARMRVERIDVLLGKWESKQRRAENAIKKLTRQRKYYANKAASGE